MNLKKRKEFLDEVHIGDHVEIQYSTWHGKECVKKGPISYLSPHRICVAKSNLDVFIDCTQYIGQATLVNLKDIIKYEKIDITKIIK